MQGQEISTRYTGLASTHSLSSGTSPLEKGWIFFRSGIAQGEGYRAGMGILIALWLVACTFGCTPVDKRVASLHFQVGGWVLIVVYAYGSNSRSEYPPILESLQGVLESTCVGESIVLLVDFNGYDRDNKS